jgi:hypothetical protein
MEEKQENTLYDDYKFLTEEEMERLGLSEYKNSDAVRAHLHGYVIRYDLYKKVICFFVNPFIVLQFVRGVQSALRKTTHLNFQPENTFI